MMEAAARSAMAGLLAALALAACDRAGDSAKGKRTPMPPPVASTAIDNKAHIEVEIDGKREAPLDAKGLDAKKADFAQGDLRAYKMGTLLGPMAEREGAMFSVTGEKGVVVSLPRPRTEKDPLPVIVVSRRGEVVAAMVTADDPFPAYHGQGGRLHRRGDPMPRIAQVTRIQVYVPQPHDDAAEDAGPKRTIQVLIQGRPTETWNAAAFAEVPHHAPPDAGNIRDAWSLRELAARKVGPGARVVALTGHEGRKELPESAWKDLSRTPVLRANKEDMFKYRWMAKDGSLAEAELREVTAIEIVP